MKYTTLSEKGTKRSINEDACIAEKFNSTYLFAVADGVGGLQHGDVASSLAINTLQQMVHAGATDIQTCFQDINSIIESYNTKNKSTMATTLTAVIINTETHNGTIAHIGDSRAYLIDNTIWRTKDHTLVQDLVDIGVITEDQAFVHPEKHRLNQALGGTINRGLDIKRFYSEHCILLLCTDGLSDYVQDREITTVACQYEPEEACKHLIQIANENGSTDDISIIIAK
jgi:protein phosphatase